MPRTSPRTEHFFGRSSTSLSVPVGFVHGVVPRRIFDPLLDTCRREFEGSQLLRKSADGTAHGPTYRINEKVAARRANGTEFRKLAPAGIRHFVDHVRGKNPKLYEVLRAQRGMSHKHGDLQVKAVEADPDDALLCYAGLMRWSTGQCTDPWHVDGGPSTVFLAVTLEGDRILEVEDADGRRTRHHFRPGDWYFSGPSCFWHRVLPVKGASAPATTLILRSATLTKRLSGGRARDDGERSVGFIYGTRECFECLAEVVANYLKKHGFRI
mmetsp:Transcript_18662/g.52100  ORF Transcript_18662/g.52100 Transcript_18662/m.52100 type:complete len:269 (+) Transcript_18662:159-965(+)